MESAHIPQLDVTLWLGDTVRLVKRHQSTLNYCEIHPQGFITPTYVVIKIFRCLDRNRCPDCQSHLKIIAIEPFLDGKKCKEDCICLSDNVVRIDWESKTEKSTVVNKVVVV